MKKLLVFLWALLAVSANVNAQGQTATLQQGDKMTPFYGENAFIQAYNAAQKGAVITLSAGEFNTVDSIMKEVTIIGNGYREKKTVIKWRSWDPDSTSLSIVANNVTLEGLDLRYVCIRQSNHLTIKHCKIFNLFGEKNNGVGSSWSFNRGSHKNTIVDQCIINCDNAHSGGENYCIKNSFINTFIRSDYGVHINTCISNCVFFQYSSTFVPAVYKNCHICLRDNIDTIANINNVECYNCVFFGGLDYKSYPCAGWDIHLTLNPDTRWVTPELDIEESQTFKNNTTASYNALFGDSDEDNPLLAPIITTITGDDGKVVGPYGGTGFSWNPSIPRIVESKIDSYTDAEGKLNAKIKVELNN